MPNTDPLRAYLFEEALNPASPETVDFKQFLWDKYREAKTLDSFEGWVKDRSNVARGALLDEFFNTRLPPTPDRARAAEQFSVDELFQKCAKGVRPESPIAGEFYDFLAGRHEPVQHVLGFVDWVSQIAPFDRLRLYETFTNRPTGRRGDGATPPTLAEKLAAAQESIASEKRSQEKGGAPPGKWRPLLERNFIPINFERYGVTKDPKDAFAGMKMATELDREAVTERVPSIRAPASYEDYAKTKVGQFVTAFARRFLGAPFAPGTQQDAEFRAYVDKVLAALYGRWAKTPARGFLWYVVERYRRMFGAADKFSTASLSQSLDDVGIRAPLAELERNDLLHFRTLRYLCDEPLDFDVEWAEVVSRQPSTIPPRVGGKSEIPPSLWGHPCGWWVRAALDPDPSDNAWTLAPMLGFPTTCFAEAVGKAPVRGDDEVDDEAPPILSARHLDDEQLAKELEDYFWEGSPAGARAAYEKGAGRPRKRGARPDEGVRVPPLTSETIKTALEKLGVDGQALVVGGGGPKWETPKDVETSASPWERDELGFALRMGATELLSARLSKHLGLPEGELPRAFSLLVLGAVFSLAESSGLIENRPALKRVIGELTPALNVWAAALGTSSAARIALEAFQDPEVADSIEWFRIEVDEASSTSAPAEPSEEPATAVPAGERAARG